VGGKRPPPASRFFASPSRPTPATSPETPKLEAGDKASEKVASLGGL
jgi:hypothetical protein